VAEVNHVSSEHTAIWSTLTCHDVDDGPEIPIRCTDRCPKAHYFLGSEVLVMHMHEFTIQQLLFDHKLTDHPWLQKAGNSFDQLVFVINRKNFQEIPRNVNSIPTSELIMSKVIWCNDANAMSEEFPTNPAEQSNKVNFFHIPSPAATAVHRAIVRTIC
jgi:hypothetical protein